MSKLKENMKEYTIEEEKIVKAFDHSMYEVTFKRSNPNLEGFTVNILARNITTLIKMIDKFKPHGEGSNCVVKIKNKGICSDVYVGDLYKY